jgi:hypothetical protein
MKAKSRKKGLIVLGALLLLLIIGFGQQGNVFTGAVGQPNKEDLDKVLREVNQMIIVNFDLMVEKQKKLNADIRASLLGNDIRRAAIKNIEEIKRVLLTENKKVNALIKDMKDMKEGKIKFDNNRIKNHIVGIRQDAIKIRNLLGHTEIVRNPNTGAQNTIYHGFNKPIFIVMDAPSKQDVANAKKALAAIMNKVAFYQNGIVPITPPVRLPTNAQIQEINKLEREAMEKEAEERRLEKKLGIGKKRTSISLISLLAQRMNNPPSKGSDPKTEAEAAALIERLRKENAARDERIQQLRDLIQQRQERQDSMDDAQSDGAEPPTTDPFAVSDGEIKIPVDEEGNIIGTFCVDKKGKTDCVIKIQVCTESGCSEIEIKISLEALLEYQKNNDFKIIEDDIREGLPEEYEDLEIQPPFDEKEDLEKKLADKIKERDAKVAEKIKILTDFITFLGKNWQDVYKDPNGKPDLDTYLEQIAELKKELDSLKKK